jgi:hypothetical protein
MAAVQKPDPKDPQHEPGGSRSLTADHALPFLRHTPVQGLVLPFEVLSLYLELGEPGVVLLPLSAVPRSAVREGPRYSLPARS